MVGRGATPSLPAMYAAVVVAETRPASWPVSSKTHRATSCQVTTSPLLVMWNVPVGASVVTRCSRASARSSAKVRRPCWSATTAGSIPRSAREAMVATKFFPSPITQEVRTIQCRGTVRTAASPAAFDWP